MAPLEDVRQPRIPRWQPNTLLTPDRSRQLTPRELVHVLLFGDQTPEYVHAMRRDLPEAIR